MYMLLISLAAGLVLNIGLLFAGVNVWLATLCALLLMVAVFLLGARHVMKKINALMETAQKDLQANRIDKAIKVLQSGLKYAPWQFYVKGQINSQIGSVYYLKREFNEAFPYLEKGFFRNWAAMGMLAICYMKRNKQAKMIETFESAVTGSKKEPLVWNLYAYCLDQVGEHEKAIAVMEKGVKKVGGHELLESNLALLREGKKMKMLPYGELWYQFHLEKPGTIIKQQTKAIQGRRKMVMR